MLQRCRWLNPVMVALFLASPLMAENDRETLRQQADRAYRQREFRRSIDLCERILAENPQDHVALYLRGSARVEKGIADGNVQLVRDGIADSREAIRHEGSGKAEYYLPYIYGMSHLSLLEGKPSHARTAQTVADSILEREDLSDEQRGNLLYQRAQTNVRLEDYPAAELDLKQAVKHSPEHLASHLLMADVAVKSRSPEAAVEAYGRVVRAFPDNPVVYNNRGMYLQSLGRTEEAIADFDRAIRIDGKFVPAYINRGFAYLESGDATNAETALTQALNVDPSQAGALSLRATARLNQNKSREALDDYGKVAEIAPHNPMSHADLGFAQFFLGEFAAAQRSFATAYELDQQLRFLLPWRLACEIRQGQLQQDVYRPALDKPEDQRDWIDRLVLFQLGKLDARSLLNSVHPDDPEARNAQLCEGYYFIGMELQRRDRPGDAVGYWRQATQRKLPKLSAYRGAVFALQNSERTTR